MADEEEEEVMEVIVVEVRLVREDAWSSSWCITSLRGLMAARAPVSPSFVGADAARCACAAMGGGGGGNSSLEEGVSVG